MPIDRAETLRNAETLLRQGKIEPAIAEYLRVLEEQPGDWTTANTLGDLYVRTGQTAKAVEQFRAIADNFSAQGFLPKASALYKKILKLVPDDEQALVQSAEIAARQGLYADARSYLNIVIDKRKSSGDKRGAAEARIRLGGLDPSDYDARMAAAAARVEIGDVSGSVQELQEIGVELTQKGRSKEAAEALRQAVTLAPDDDGIRTRLLQLYVAAEDFAGAREYATTIAQLQSLADSLDLRGRHEEALEILRDAEWIDPNDAEMKAHLARALLVRGDVGGAQEFLTVDAAGDDPQLLLTAAEIQFRAGKTAESAAIVRRVLTMDPSRAEQVAAIAANVAEQLPDPAFALLDPAIESLIARHEWQGAVTALQDFVTHAPAHIAALMRLVEVCVDGGLEATMYSAQRRLADAYLAAGQGAEARTIAEDLVAREPWEVANIDRFRRALLLTGERNPDSVIANRLSGDDTPFTATDRTPRGAPEPADAPEAPTDAEAGPTGGHAIDIQQILEELEPASESAPLPAGEEFGTEIDLSVVLDDITADANAAPPSPEAVEAPAVEPDIDEVFAQFRAEASKTLEVDTAQQDYIKALALRDAGDLSGCMTALASAARSPRVQFAAESLLGRLCKERGQLNEALEPLERAAEAEPPSPADYHELLLDLADTLEASGETARALAVCLELQSDAGDYRDVGARIERLSRVQTRG